MAKKEQIKSNRQFAPPHYNSDRLKRELMALPESPKGPQYSTLADPKILQLSLIWSTTETLTTAVAELDSVHQRSSTRGKLIESPLVLHLTPTTSTYAVAALLADRIDSALRHPS